MRPIFYLHIPKTGGQTLAKRMASAFSPSRTHYLQSELRYPVDLERFADLVRTRDFIESHVQGPLLAHQPEIDVLATIREPISRLISSYRHIRREPADRLYRAAHVLTPAEFFRNHADSLTNNQSHALIHAMFMEDRVNHLKGVHTDWIYRKLPEAVGRMTWLVPTEAIDDFTRLWARASRTYLPQSEIVVNTADPDDVSVAHIRRVIEDRPELYALDLELWNWANRWMRTYRKTLLSEGIDRRTASTVAFENGDNAIWLTGNWLPPAVLDDGVTEWWAGPDRTSEVLFRRSGEQAILLEIRVVLGIAHTDIEAYAATDFRKLDTQLIYERPDQPTLRIDLSGMGPEGRILIDVPEVFSSAQVNQTDPDVKRRSFASAQWRFEDTGQ